MTYHKWEIEEVDGGHMGVADFWKCDECGASGGLVNPIMGKPPALCFYADGMGLQLLPNDCEKSKQMIEEHLKKTKK